MFTRKIFADAFLGPICEYVIAPVARYAGAWRIPVLTAAAQADAFRHKSLYPTLTRMMGSYYHVGEALRRILESYGWRVAGLLYHDFGHTSSQGFSICYFTLGAVFQALNEKPTHKSFNENNTTARDYRELLLYLAKSSRSEF